MLNLKFPIISSFFVSLCIYLSIVVCIFINLSIFTDTAKRYTNDKDAFVDVLIVEREISDDTKSLKIDDEVKSKDINPSLNEKDIAEKMQTSTKDIAEKNENLKEIGEDLKDEKPNIKDLFSDIDLSKIQEQKIQSRKKDEKKISIKSSAASDIVKSLKIDTKITTKESKTQGVYDPLKGAISKQIERRWREYKANSDNVSKIKIMIDSVGNFSYEIFELSYDDEFNKKVRECLERLTLEKFPFSPNGDSIVLNLELVDKIEI